MGPSRARALVFDFGAFIAFERNDRRVRSLVELAVKHRSKVETPAGVVAQVWRDGARQVRLARPIGSGIVEVRPLGLDEAQAVGALCAQSDAADIVDASVALLARRLEAVVVSSDPDELLKIDPQLEIVTC